MTVVPARVALPHCISKRPPRSPAGGWANIDMAEPSDLRGKARGSMGIPHVGHNEPVCGEEERGARVEVDFFWVVRGARLEDTVGRGRDNARAAMGGDTVGARAEFGHRAESRRRPQREEYPGAPPARQHTA